MAPEFRASGLACDSAAERSGNARLAGDVVRLRGARWQQQVEQGRYVFTGITPIALTAHVAAAEGGVSGPYPWRPPV